MRLTAPRDTAIDECALLAGAGLAARRIAAPFPIWLVEPRATPSDAVLDCLSAAELARAARFRLSAHRNRYLAAHGALRLLGESYFGIVAARQRYAANAWGKPLLVGHRRAECSISYSGDSAAIAWSWGEQIGVDIELVRPVADAPELARLHFTDREQRELAALEPGSIDFATSFLTVWVRKEASVKALGRGLSIPPSSFECGAGRDHRVIDMEGAWVESQVVLKDTLLVSWARARARGRRRRSDEGVSRPSRWPSPRRALPAAGLRG